MTLRLHHSPNSPYVRKVMVLLLETGNEGMVERVPGGGLPTDLDQTPRGANPLGKIPCLERPDGPALYDSRVITRWLDDHFGAGLYPAAPRLWDTLVIEALADGMTDAALLMAYEWRVRPEGARHAPWVEAQWTKVARALEAVEAEWMGHLQGPVDMGHIALGCALGYLDFRHAARDWRRDRPVLAAWAEGFAARPSMLTTLPPG